MIKRYEFKLGEKNYNGIVFNQYDKNYPVDFLLSNYEHTEGDIFKIEWAIRGLGIIQTTNIELIEDNVLRVILPREVALNSGNGQLNIAIERVIDDDTTMRIATLTDSFKIIGNSIDENTVNETIVATIIEALESADNTATEKLDLLLEAINTSALEQYAKKTEVAADLENKVDKITGKGLSTNDFTNTLLEKLNSLYKPNTFSYTDNTNANDITWDSCYYVNNMLNTPYQYGMLRTMVSYNNHLRHIFYNRGTNNIKTRFKKDGEEWGSWERFCTTKIDDVPKSNLPTFTCPEENLSKYDDRNTHNWYQVKNGICFVHFDIVTPVPNLNRYWLFKSGLPKPSCSEVWFTLTSPSATIGRWANMVIDNNGGARVDRVTTNGRFIGITSYPVLEE